jgi:hypothetical protein
VNNTATTTHAPCNTHVCAIAETIPPSTPVIMTTLFCNNRDQSPLGLDACSGAPDIPTYDKIKRK